MNGGRLTLGGWLAIAAIALATCNVHNQNPVKLPDAPTPESGPAPPVAVTSTAPQGEPDTAAIYARSLPLAPSPAEALAAYLARPVRPGLRWVRLDGARIEAHAPAGAIGYRDGGLVRTVYWDCERGTPVGWIGKLRLTRYCGHPESEIVIEYDDGRVETVKVPVVRCGGY